MVAITFLALVVAGPDLAWHTDYDSAASRAIREKKDLVVYFRADDRLDAVLREPEVREQLSNYVCLQVLASYEYDGKRLLDHPALEEMMGKPGLVVASYRDPGASHYQQVISAHPLVKSRYRWVPDYGIEEIKIILNLPPGTLTQRSMIYAVRVHPERPQSVFAMCHPAFLAHAERHSLVQANALRQHHADLIAASARLQQETGRGLGGACEVVAQSWGKVLGGENVLEAALSCVDAWRQSPGHWSAVAGAHGYFGYDIARGSNGTWYATGIFAD